jgi:hypothetical protein
MSAKPKTLQQAILYFADPDNCLKFVVGRRWPNGVECPTCGSKEVRFLATRRMWECKSQHARKQFSVKIGTIFEDSPISLDKWLTAMWMIANCKNGISSYEVGRAIGITQKSAWFMMHRIRLTMHANHIGQLGGDGKEVEADETYIGGKAINMHISSRRRRISSTGPKGKQPVWGALERGGEVRTAVIPTTRKKHIQPEVRKHIAAGSALYTDAIFSYQGMSEYEHQVIDHAVRYVNGRVHTNGMENFWSLVKRGLKGTYVSVEPFHLFRYLDEQAFRYNYRKKPMDDGARFETLASHVIGKRITYAELTGTVGRTNN